MFPELKSTEEIIAALGDDVEFLKSTIWYIINNHPLYGYLRPRSSSKSLSALSAANFSYFSLSSLSFFSFAY